MDNSNAEAPAKRRRRSGWDSEVPSTNTTTSTTTTIPPAPAVNAAALLALQKAQIAQQTINQSLMQNLVTKPVEKRESRIYVGSLHYDIKEADVRALFESFGPIRYSEMQMDPLTGKSKGFCFLEFETPEASDAAQAMDGFELAGRRIKVGRPLGGSHVPFGQAKQSTAPLNNIYSPAATLSQIVMPTIAPILNGLTPKQQAEALLSQALGCIAASNQISAPAINTSTLLQQSISTLPSLYPPTISSSVTAPTTSKPNTSASTHTTSHSSVSSTATSNDTEKTKNNTIEEPLMTDDNTIILLPNEERK